MTRALAHKLLQLLPVLVLVTVATTALVDLMPGSPGRAILGPDASPEAVAALDAQHGFDDPLPQRYLSWLGHALTGDLGSSVSNRQPVTDLIGERLPVTFEIALLALLLSVAVAVPLALWVAARPGGLADRVVSALTSATLSIPSFAVALVLAYLLAVNTHVFPVSGWVPFEDSPADNLRHVALPVFSLALAEIPIFVRILRGDLLTVLRQDFILTARTKGFSTPHVLLRHALRPASPSLVTLAGLAAGRLIGGTVIIESLFALPGLGNLATQAIYGKDLPVIQGVVLVVALSYVAVNALVDLLNSAIDPRTRTA
ncbi:ABC transporter permease [Frankia sp. CNm7]|uniref:ABC transporter permease n=1 Tax=Frankia nepalensis TaxID=1836974 RepID=A0A937RNC4_9ACTN|nr:ABC transporter permease [Frankia nepalensis]MBL7498683.1 ABC transporter permease [Frankia nepalensis]MBL7509152.1 ABC transporter permease [Frankia nepalensis]MBL7518780.1 ABC transporter permease [Frankia nepalensis]MBL7633232.1 ABC transporter permease [Frankia nepalensis]